MMMPANFAPACTMQGQPTPQYNVPAALATLPPPAVRQAAPPSAPLRQPPPSQPMLAQQETPRPVFRGQVPEEPIAPAPPLPLAMLAIPSPEQLGVSCTKADVAVDRNAVHARLENLGATCVHEEKQADGGYRITCMLPTAQPGCSHCVAAQANNSVDALRAVLDEAESWAARK